MAGVVLIISIPTEEHEKCLLKKIKKKVVIEEKPPQNSPVINGDHFRLDFEKCSTSNENDGSGFSVKKEYQSMEKVIKSLAQELELLNITWSKTKDNNHYQITFPIECGDKCQEVLDILYENKIGSKLNSKISVLPCTIYHHGNEFKENEEINEEDLFNDKKSSGWNLFISSIKSRLTVAQVVENVKAEAAMTFNFIMLLLISTTMCAWGLVENNKILMLSSMLISPMMGPVMAGTFGSIIRHKHLQKTGVQNELIGLGIATVVGCCYGSVICITTDRYGTSDWPTYEMYSRGAFRSLWVGAIIAFGSGAAVALGVLSDNIASLVGVAISTYLMPPAVNAGLLWSLGFVYYLKSDETTRYVSLTHTDYFSKNSAIELTTLGAVSICLTFVNIICIYAGALLIFMIKQVAPNTSQNQARKRFWKHDIKVARDCNRTTKLGESADSYQNILQQMAASQRTRDLNHFTTDLSRGNFRINIKRPEYTWSPYFNDIYNRHEILLSGECTSPRMLNFLAMKHYKNEYRRLSQIFKNSARKEETVDEIPEQISMTSPLLSSGGLGASTGNTYLLSSGKKVIVTRCEL